MITVQLAYSEDVIKAAVKAFWLRTAGWKFIFVLSLALVFTAYLIVSGNRSWLVGALGTATLFGAVMSVALYVVHLRRSMAKLAAMKTPVATLNLGEESFRVTSGAGTAELPWSAVKEVWQFESIWLVLFSPAEFITLPLADLQPEARDFILSKVPDARIRRR